jgi:hypothetical protein
MSAYRYPGVGAEVASVARARALRSMVLCLVDIRADGELQFHYTGDIGMELKATDWGSRDPKKMTRQRRAKTAQVVLERCWQDTGQLTNTTKLGWPGRRLGSPDALWLGQRD